MAVFAMLTTANTVILVLTAASRMFFAMSRNDDLPSIGARLTKTGSPWVGVIFSAVVATGFVIWGELKLIASATDFAIYAIFLSVNVMVIVLRRREPDRERPFRSPWTCGKWPVLPVIGFVITVWMIALLEFDAVLVGVGLFVVGGGIALGRQRRWAVERSSA